MRRIIITIIFIIHPLISFGDEFNYKKKLSDNKSSIIFLNINTMSKDFNYKKPIFTNKNTSETKKKPKINNNQHIENDNLSYNNSTGRLRFLFFIPLTLQYVNETGLGISVNNINTNIDSNNVTNNIDVNALSLSYALIYDNYSYGLGISFFDSKSYLSGCSDYDICYDGERDLNNGLLMQVMYSYNLSKYFEIVLGINNITFTLDKYNHPTNNNGNIDESNFSIFAVNMGLGYIFE